MYKIIVIITNSLDGSTAIEIVTTFKCLYTTLCILEESKKVRLFKIEGYKKNDKSFGWGSFSKWVEIFF